MARINVSFQDDGRAIRAIGDVFRGWQVWEHGYGFFGRGLLELPGGWRLTIDLQVRARPNQSASLAKDFPRNLTARYGEPTLHYSLEDWKLTGYCYLPSHLRWLPNSGKPGIYWAPDPPILWNGVASFYVVLSIVFNQTWYSFKEDVIEKDLLPFFAGGQSESNRRRH
jgi:hypothetical protein